MLPTWDQQQRGKTKGEKTKGLFYSCCFFRVGAQEGMLIWGEGKAFVVALDGQIISLLSCLLFDEARVNCSETVSSPMASI